MDIINNSDSVIIILHEIYGINQHIEMVCKKFSMMGYDIICPNLITQDHPFSYDLEEMAYEYFRNNIGFDLAVEQVKKLIIQAKKEYRQVFLLGYSIGATIAWLCSSDNNMCDGIIGYYGSRIRDYLNIIPKCQALLIFACQEESFNVRELVDSLRERNIDTHILIGKHGFCNPFSNNYCPHSSEEAGMLTDKFLKCFAE